VAADIDGPKQRDDAHGDQGGQGRSAPHGRRAPEWWDTHPGFAESLIPVWGSGREAVADYEEGKTIEAGVNAGLAISDLFLANSVARGLAKGGFKLAGSHSWGATRKWMGVQKFLGHGQPGHHWLIPQNGWGRKVPEIIKNQPFNIKGMPNAEVHGRLHGRYKGKPAFNPAQKFMAATPTWFKTMAGADTVRGGLLAYRGLHHDQTPHAAAGR
jgi:hypothetical protein